MIFQRLKNVLQKSLHREVILASGILTLLVLAFFAIDAVRSYRAEIKSAKTVTQNLTQVLESHLNETFSEIDYRLKDISHHLSQIEELSTAQRLWSRNLFDGYLQNAELDSNGQTLDLMLFDQQGRMLKSVKQTGAEKLMTADYAQLAKQDLAATTFSDPVFDPKRSEWILFMQRSYQNQKNYRGSVVAVVRIKYFQSYFEALNVGEDGVVALFTYNRYVVARKPARADVFGKKINLAFVDSGETRQTYVRESKVDGRVRIVTQSKIGKYPFGVTVALSKSEVTNPWLRRTLFNAVLILSAFAGFGTFLFRYLESQEDLEEQRKQNIAHAKMSSLGEMASGIAHEINNPLAIIQAKVFQIRKIIEQPDQMDRNKIFEHADKLEITVERIAKIIKGLKSFSRNSEADPMSISSAGAVIENTLEFCRARFKANAIELRLSNIPDAYIKCRESQMAQVLLNLLNNAFDAITEIPEKWVAVDVRELPETVEISVTDSGQGIPADILKKVMYPFFTTKQVGKGTGLGLSISKGIVEEHGGTLRYESQSENTCFVISLPKVSADSSLKIAS